MPGTQLPETDLRRIARYCDDSVPTRVRDQVRLEAHVRGRSVTICETRTPMFGIGDWTHHGVAQLRYREEQKDWALYWADRNSRWHEYHEGNIFAGSVVELLAEIDADPTCIFMG